MRSLVLVVLVACGNDRAPTVTQDPVEFPNLARLYDGDHGIYRGCGPNGNVCHNGNEYPNLGSLGSIVDSIGGDCNQKRSFAVEIHDMCERPGDLVEVSGEPIEIAYIAPVEGSGTPPRTYSLVLRHAPTSFAGTQPLTVTRDGAIVATLGDLVSSAALDPADPRAIALTMFPDPGGGQYDLGADVSLRLSRAGVPGDPETLRVGDPNRNGVFGAELGASLIHPGDPDRSYLLRRLVDPAAGPLMPRANCCYWTKPALRALWCWVAGLHADGSNALDAIDYASCPAMPAIELDYPEPGPGCETSGLCPITAIEGTP